MRARWIVAAAAVIAVLVVGASWFVFDRTRQHPFPEVDAAGLNERQTRVVELLRAEHAANPGGAKYSEGVREPWCANFVSWIMREAGAPLANPNSGHWRIPGVYTLTEFYQKAQLFQPRDGAYEPKVGDVVLYSPSSKYGQHTNIVVRNDSGRLTTVGGNEGLGVVGVRVVDTTHAGIVGYGVL